MITSIRRPLQAGTVLLSVASLVVAARLTGGPAARPGVDDVGPGECAPGYELVDRAELVAEAYLGTVSEGGAPKTADQMLEPTCMSLQRPEPFSLMLGMQSERLSRNVGPHGQIPYGAFRRAAGQHQAMKAAPPDVPGGDGALREVGRGPLVSNHDDFDSVNGLGLVDLAGRIDSFAYDDVNDRLFAVIGTGGLWMSEDRGGSWESVGDSLPTQIHGAVGWSPEPGPDGTLILVSGEHLHGGNTYTGLGAFWSDDVGQTWHQSTGVPDEALGFEVAVDPEKPEVVYVANSMGLFRSDDHGHTFANVNLPTGDCAGVTGYGHKCQWANFVTDVVIKQPSGVGDDTPEAGSVLAAVGYRAGRLPYVNSTSEQHAPYNGLYRSTEDGAIGSFEYLDVSDNSGQGVGFAAEDRIGRTELGVALGPDQDHDYVYAIVQDAVKLNGGVPFIDVPEGQATTGAAIPNFSSLNGIYVSADFGDTWRRMADNVELQLPVSESALAIGACPVTCPGIQAWYNMWIEPDPTQQTAAGVPTQLLFGLEEIWQNRVPGAPQDQSQLVVPASFKVVGPYFADESCLFRRLALPYCPPSNTFADVLTTHPDQHDAIWLPNEDGSVDLVVGNDGGAYVQHVEPGAEVAKDQWGPGNNDGFHTLLLYDVAVAKDGTMYMGLQDNGTAIITPEDEAQYMVFGGDGTYVAVDPNDPNYAWSATPQGAMRVTTDGGRTWTNRSPAVTLPKFVNPFVMDPTDSNHLLTAGAQVKENLNGAAGPWVEVFQLGTSEGENGAAAPNSVSAVDLYGDSAYVAFCGVCDVLNNTHVGFHNGIATNVAGDDPPERGTSAGWHIAAAEGLDNRYISSVAIDEDDHETIFVTLAGYANRQWVPPGSYLDPNEDIGEGMVFVSTDAGESFTDISGNLPVAPAYWVETHGDQLVVGTELGAYISDALSPGAGGVLAVPASGDLTWAPITGLPNVPINTLRNHPGDPDTIVLATFGRGVYEYDFNEQPDPTETPTDPGSESPTDTESPTDDPTATTSPGPTVAPTGGGTETGDGDGDDDDPDTPTTGGGSAGVAAAALLMSVLLGWRVTRRRV